MVRFKRYSIDGFSVPATSGLVEVHLKQTVGFCSNVPTSPRPDTLFATYSQHQFVEIYFSLVGKKWLGLSPLCSWALIGQYTQRHYLSTLGSTDPKIRLQKKHGPCRLAAVLIAMRD